MTDGLLASLDALESIARGASPGPWRWRWHEGEYGAPERGWYDVASPSVACIANDPLLRDALHLAAFHPEVALAFIALARASFDLRTPPESESQALDQIRALDAALDQLAAVLGTEGDDGA